MSEDVIENIVEGPQNKISLHLSSREYLSKPPHARKDWFYDQLMQRIPSGEIRDAISVSKKEDEARQLANNDEWGKPLVETTIRHAFRCFKRRSNNQPLEDNLKATKENAQQNIYNEGIEAPVYEMIMPDHIWALYLLPTPVDLNQGIDRSNILVYKCVPFVLPTNPGAETTKRVDVTIPQASLRTVDISITEAKKIPTLRDIFVGEVEITWKNENVFSRIMDKLQTK